VSRAVIVMALLLPASVRAFTTVQYCRVREAMDAVELVCDFPDEQVIPAEPPRPVLVARKPRRPPIYVLSLGAGYRALHGFPYGAGQADLAVGGEMRGTLELLGHVIVEAGAAHPRVPLTHVRAGVSLRGIVQRFRIGIGIRFGLLVYRRVTDGDHQRALTVAPFVNASIDVLKRGRYAMFLGADVAFDVAVSTVDSGLLATSTSLSVAATGVLGARL
jgi:hypothetical protein